MYSSEFLTRLIPFHFISTSLGYGWENVKGGLLPLHSSLSYEILQSGPRAAAITPLGDYYLSILWILSPSRQWTTKGYIMCFGRFIERDRKWDHVRVAKKSRINLSRTRAPKSSPVVIIITDNEIKSLDNPRRAIHFHGRVPIFFPLLTTIANNKLCEWAWRIYSHLRVTLERYKNSDWLTNRQYRFSYRYFPIAANF